MPSATPDFSAPVVSDALLERTRTLLELPAAVPNDLDGLAAVYAAWCLHVPFDNVRKLIALGTGRTGPLPGAEASDFFEHFVEHGTGGTCWSSSNALFVLLDAMGFDARRVAGSMRDTGIPGHGSVKVAIDGADWLVDSSMLMKFPIPLPSTLHVDRHPIFGVEVEPGEDSHLIWFDTPPHPEYFPCRIMLDPVTHDFYRERYEISRTSGPFNHHLSVRYNRGDARMVIQANMHYRQTSDGVVSTVMTRDELRDTLVHDVGMSAEIVRQFAECGALEAAFEPPRVASVPLSGRPPSRRGTAPVSPSTRVAE